MRCALRWPPVCALRRRADMAIYHLSVKPMSRKGGRSATAAIAYRAAEKIHDLTSDQVFDYTRKRGVEHTEIVLPTAAAKHDINWARDRQQLWNAAEMAEKRKDARVAREYEVALPHELNRGQRVELVRAFAADLANRYGVAVDFAIHAPHRSGDERNHHAHIMTTTREVTATGLGAKADIELGDRDRGKKGLQSGALEIDTLRARWETLTNEHLREHQIEARIDRRSLEAQGIEREPQSHLGPSVSSMERRGMLTDVGQRLVAERAAAVLERANRVAELAEVRQEQQSLKVSMLDLSAALSLARRERGLEAPTAAEWGPELDASNPAERLMGEVKARAQELGAASEGATKVSKKRGMFDGLKFNPERGQAFEKVELSVAAPTSEQVRAQAVEALHESIDRYARAWMDASRMQEKGLPILEHQITELQRAGKGLDQARPGASQDLWNALEYEPDSHRAMTTLEGRERTTELLAGIERERRIQRDPELEAERLVKVWNGLEAERAELKGSEHAHARERVKGRVRELALKLKRDPELERVLKRRGPELGIAPGSRLARVIEEPDIKRALSLSQGELGRSLGLGM